MLKKCVRMICCMHVTEICRLTACRKKLLHMVFGLILWSGIDGKKMNGGGAGLSQCRRIFFLQCPQRRKERPL